MIGLGENDFIPPNENDINKVIQVLNVLKTGQSLKLDEFEYKLASTLNDSYGIVYKTEVHSGDNLEAKDRWFGLNMSLESFIKTCLEADDEVITVGVANSVLNKIKKDNGIKRN